MAEQRNKLERRPAHIPAEWLTRQQAALRLQITAYLLRQYMGLLTHEFQTDFFDLGAGRPAYLSPTFVDAIQTLHNRVESADKVPDYFNRTQTVQMVGCSESQFFNLIQGTPPGILAGDMRLLRNRNSEIFPYYSNDYIKRLKIVYDSERGDRARRERGGGEGSHSPSGPVVNRPSDILRDRTERFELSKKPLVELSLADRRELLGRVEQVSRQLRNVERHYRRDRTFQGIVRQLEMAAIALRGTDPLPSGLENLLNQALRYLEID